MPALLDITTDIAWERAEVSMQSIGNGSHDANNSWSEELWKNYYISVARCNYLLDNMERAKAETTPAVYERIKKGEVQFLRAYFYLMLTETWGDVPLVTKTLTLAEAQIPQTSKSAIVDFILKELDEAIPVLPVHIDANEWGRISKGNRSCYKARDRFCIIICTILQPKRLRKLLTLVNIKLMTTLKIYSNLPPNRIVRNDVLHYL